MAIVNHAYNKYNQATPKTQIVKGVPRHKFNFTASFNYGADFATKHLELDKIASITMPSWTSSAITMNAYNAKKVVQTNYEYSPITIVAYDTHSPSTIQTFLKEYSNYYFAGPMNMSSGEFAIFGPNMGTSSPLGFKLNANKNFIKTLKIVRRDNQSTNLITVFNPIITSIDADTLDYADSSLVQYRLTLMYEGYNMEDITAIESS